MYKETECKLCMDRNSEMMNTECGHIMMCEVCFLSYQRSKGRALEHPAECPVCKTVGTYFKFKKPIFA